MSFTSQGEAEVDALLSGLESELGGQVLETTWEVSGDALVFHMGEPGRAFDMAAVKADILDRFARQDFSDFQISPAITDPAPVDAQAIHTQLYALAQNATLDRETYEVVPASPASTSSLPRSRRPWRGPSGERSCPSPSR